MALIESPGRGSCVCVKIKMFLVPLYFADDFESALREVGWKALRIKNRTVIAYGIPVATVEGTAAAQICTRKQNNERPK